MMLRTTVAILLAEMLKHWREIKGLLKTLLELLIFLYLVVGLEISFIARFESSEIVSIRGLS